MSKDARIQVLPLGNGRYCVITTTGQVVTTAELEAMGLRTPAPDVPWPAEPQRVVPGEERASALQYWHDKLGGYEPRLSGRIVIFLREFGLDGVKQAIDQVAVNYTKGGAAEKYHQLVRVMREMRERAGGVG